MQPGQTITPGQQPSDSTQTAEKPTEKTEVSTQEVLPTPPVVPESPIPVPDPETAPADPAPATYDNNLAVKWTASEYVDHAKGPLWFMGLGVGLFVVVALVYLLLKDIFTAVLIGLAGVTFGIFAGRRPRVLEYAIDSGGIHIGERGHAFSEFKSFSLTQSSFLPTILLMPLKRFMPPITIFYDPNDEDRIIDALANYLPHEDREPDLVDRLMSRIRF